MYKFKGVARRGTALAAAVALLSGIASSALPGIASADALNPLTERTLLLSSSAPGFVETDGAGNPQSIYSQPGTGPNGKKTGETFSFKVSTDSSGAGADVKAFTLQYCTTPAGYCTGPGNDLVVSTVRQPDDATHSDLNITYGSPVEGTDFSVKVNGTTNAGWTMTTGNLEDGTGDLTAKNNYITLVKAAGIAPAAGATIELKFNASNTQFITNPGAGAFFVKINTYDDDAVQNFRPNYPTLATPQNVIDGGVTVANVMTDSIQIQTKVLETMSFSVGTTNPDTQDPTPGTHGTCDAISVNDPIKLGNSQAEYSLEIGTAYDGHSYWRLSSNSSGGATVYYSGYTLSNTVGDQIQPIGTTAQISHYGTEQFGLALDTTADTLDSAFSTLVTNQPLLYSNPHLTPLVAQAPYGGGAGTINSANYTNNTALFAFNPTSATVPEVIAQESTDVLHCSTGKMRYIANIAADTPSGIYTSKVNYLAAPQY